SEQALNAVHDSLLSPIAWDLGHIATLEDLWLAQRTFGKPPVREELGDVYNQFTAPRGERGRLPYLRSEDCLDYMSAVRKRTLSLLEHADLSQRGGRLLTDGYIYQLVARHERQHSETILQTLQIMTGEQYAPGRETELPGALEEPKGMVRVPGGPFEMGTDSRFAYDNERPRHVRELDAFWIDAHSVTNGRMLEFIEDGGYDRREWWSKRGWEWKQREEADLPRYWQRDGYGFLERSLALLRPLDPLKPVCHVSWYEADAYARYADARLPTEAEWEKAASWDGASGLKRPYPWGDDPPDTVRASLDQLAFETAQAGAYPRGASACGAHQMVGDVWEWTSSGFEPYEGFRAFPYREYSEVFFGGPFKGLRGGAWSTQRDAVSTTFRNWDYPE
ncbi:hypothetical protein LCGC14_2876530, partial [marine sediment metagenome]